MPKHPMANFDLSQLASVSHPVEGLVSNHKSSQRFVCCHPFTSLAVSSLSESLYSGNEPAAVSARVCGQRRRGRSVDGHGAMVAGLRADQGAHLAITGAASESVGQPFSRATQTGPADSFSGPWRSVQHSPAKHSARHALPLIFASCSRCVHTNESDHVD